MKIKQARGPVRWFLSAFGYRGITLPPFGIYILPGHTTYPPLIRHEQVHWQQYEQRGAIRFYVGYLLLLVRHGYRNHPWEIEARSAE